ncbi:MAG: tyrosine-type recombinase/integrase [Candidatus Sigynarchaeota archaeon]
MIPANKNLIERVCEKYRRDGMKDMKGLKSTLTLFLNDKDVDVSMLSDDVYHVFLDKYADVPNTHNNYLKRLNKMRAVLGLPRLDRKYRRRPAVKRLNLKQTSDDYQKLYNAAGSDRDRVLLALMRYGGLRAGELVGLTRDAFEIHDDYVLLRFDRPKTGINSEIVLVECAGLLANYFERSMFAPGDVILPARQYKGRAGQKARSGRESLNYMGIWGVVRRLCKKAGVQFHPHLFRHFRATELARTKLVNKWDLDNVFGWSHQSATANVYVNLAESETRDKLLELHGLKPVEERAPVRKCQRCLAVVPAEEKRCQRCFTPVDPAEALKFIEAQRKAEATYEKISDLGELIAEFKAMKAALAELKKKKN